MNCICISCGTTQHADGLLHDESLCVNGHDDWLEYRDIVNAFQLNDSDAKRVIRRARKLLKMTVEDMIDLMKGGICI